MRVNRISRARRRGAVGLALATLAAGATAGAGPAVAQPKAAPAAAAPEIGRASCRERVFALV